MQPWAPGSVRVSDAFVPRYSVWVARPGRKATHARVRPVRLRKRVAEGPRASYPSRGWGSCGGIVMGIPPGPSPDREVRPQRRSLQPAVQRSHDERCPSGSDRGQSSLSTPVRARGREGGTGGASRGCPLIRETSTGTVHGVGWGFGPRPYGAAVLPVPPAGIPVLAMRHVAQAIVRSCSRVVAVAEVDERRLVQAGRPGSSSPAPTLTRASSGGEGAPEAGSRWRKPRAREQRDR